VCDLRGRRKKVSEGATWWQPFVGARLATSFTQNWRLLGRADYGYGSFSDHYDWDMTERGPRAGFIFHF
jgi:hypothetical protein